MPKNSVKLAAAADRQTQNDVCKRESLCVPRRRSPLREPEARTSFEQRNKGDRRGTATQHDA